MTNVTCAVAECCNVIAAKGLCESHYARNRRYGSPLIDKTRKRSLCTIDGCEKMARAHRLCDMHETRVRRHGTPTVTVNAPRDATLDERLRWTGWTVTEAGCWEWKGSRRNGGYGEVATGNGAAVASRAAYEAWVAPVPEGKDICHTCDNPPCINPKHLFPGTRRENMQDATRKGRLPNGEASHHAKLTAREIADIRKAYTNGDLTQREVAKMFGTSQANVSLIVRALTWKANHAIG